MSANSPGTCISSAVGTPPESRRGCYKNSVTGCFQFRYEENGQVVCGRQRAAGMSMTVLAHGNSVDLEVGEVGQRSIAAGASEILNWQQSTHSAFDIAILGTGPVDIEITDASFTILDIRFNGGATEDSTFAKRIDADAGFWDNHVINLRRDRRLVWAGTYTVIFSNAGDHDHTKSNSATCPTDGSVKILRKTYHEAFSPAQSGFCRGPGAVKKDSALIWWESTYRTELLHPADPFTVTPSIEYASTGIQELKGIDTDGSRRITLASDDALRSETQSFMVVGDVFTGNLDDWALVSWGSDEYEVGKTTNRVAVIRTWQGGKCLGVALYQEESEPTVGTSVQPDATTSRPCSIPLNDGQWHSVKVTFSLFEITTETDGVPQNTWSRSGSAALNIGATEVIIGATTGTVSNLMLFAGMLRAVRIFPTVDSYPFAGRGGTVYAAGNRCDAGSGRCPSYCGLGIQ